MKGSPCFAAGDRFDIEKSLRIMEQNTGEG